MANRTKPLSMKDGLVLQMLRTQPPGPIDLDNLAWRLYSHLRLEPPIHWRTTMSASLQRLSRRGVKLRREGGRRGRGVQVQWMLLASPPADPR